MLFDHWGKAAMAGDCLEEPAWTTKQASLRRVSVNISLVLVFLLIFKKRNGAYNLARGEQSMASMF